MSGDSNSKPMVLATTLTDLKRPEISGRFGFRNWRSFKSQVITLVVLSSILPAFCLGSLAYGAQRRQILESYENLLGSVAHEGARQIDVWLTEQEATATSMAQSGELIENWDSYHRLPEESDEAFLDLFRLHRIIRLCNESSKWITEVRLLNLDGSVVLSDNVDAVKGLEFRPEGGVDLDAIVKDGKTVHSEVYLAAYAAPQGIDSENLDTGFPTMFVMAPIRGEAKVAGILGCRMAVADLGRKLFPKDAGNLPLDVFLIGPDGQIFASNHEAQPWKLPHQVLPGSLDGGPAGRDLEGYSNYRDETVVGSWQKVPHTDWTVVVQVLQAEMVKPLQQVAHVTLAVATALGILFAAVAFFLAGHILKPLHKVIRAALQLAQGNRAVRVNLQRNDEIGWLGQSFDQMAATVETTLAGMETARDQALAATRTKSRFLANMTHELRTPLNAVIGYSEMLIGEAQDAKQDSLVADLEVIRTAGKDLLALINGILDVSKVEAGKMEMQREHFVMEDLLKEIVTLFVPLIEAGGNRLKTPPLENNGATAPLGEVYLDRVKLKQILLNLLSNACKFTQKGVIELSGKREGEELWLEVKDSGIGISAEQQQIVFEEFSQADGSTTRKYGGTGLGLTIVQRFVDLMGAHIVLESELGKGSTFRLHFSDVSGGGETEPPQ